AANSMRSGEFSRLQSGESAERDGGYERSEGGRTTVPELAMLPVFSTYRREMETSAIVAALTHVVAGEVIHDDLAGDQSVIGVGGCFSDSFARIYRAYSDCSVGGGSSSCLKG
ncbi:hypothetical protein U1Q18_011173, partial [Sarracenia purpurea var. burkii]